LTRYTEKHHFMFDEIFNEEDDNEEVYGQAVVLTKASEQASK